jgi:glycosyltransferase involved in cell wall biosynthesis
MLSNNLVSIIVPTFNFGNLIEDTLHSVRHQSYHEFECIVVDDGSTDDTPERVATVTKKDSRFVYHYQNNRGLGSARNVGINKSRGDYVQFLDSDDLLEPEKIARQVDYLEQHPVVDIVYGLAVYFDSEPPVAPAAVSESELAVNPRLSANDPSQLKSFMRPWMPVNAPLIRRQVIDGVGEFEATIRQVEDWDYWIRCAAGGFKFQFCDWENARALVRSHPASMSKNRADALGQYLLLRAKIARHPYPVEVLSENDRLRRELIGLHGVEEFGRGRIFKGLTAMVKASWFASTPRAKAKWLACSLCAPFLCSGDLRRLVTKPLTSSGRCG